MSAPKSRSARAPLFAAAGVLALATAAWIAVWLAREERDGAPPAPGWVLEAGDLTAPDGSPSTAGLRLAPGEYVARSEVKLGLGASSITLDSDSRIEIAADGSVAGVRGGEATLEAAEPLRIGFMDIAPVERAWLRIAEDGITVERGSIRVEGRVLEPGARFGRSEIVREPAVEPAAADAPRYRAGRVVDASTGAPVEGAIVRAVWFPSAGAAAPRAEDAPEAADRAALEAEGMGGAAGVPGFALERVETDAGGAFELALLFPESPLVSLHVQVDHPAFLPETDVSSARENLDGSFPEMEIRLRRGLTLPLEILDAGGAPLADAPLLVALRREGHDFIDEPSPAPGWNGRIVKVEPPRLLFTDEGGLVRLPWSEHLYDLELVDPEHHLYLKDIHGELRGRLSLRPPLEGPFRIVAARGWACRHRVVDLDGVPAALSPVEIALEGMPPLRVVTDEEGWFTVGVTPFPGPPPLGYANPRRGVLTVIGPDLFRRNAAILLPSLEPDIVVEGRRAGRIHLRCVAGGPPVPVMPEGLAVSGAFHIEERRADGVVVLRGTLPPPGEPIDFHVRGFLPARALALPVDRGQDLMDLGDVILDPGWSRAIELSGVDAAALEGAEVVLVEEGGFVRLERRHRVGPDGSVRVGGLRRAIYSISAEGPRILTASFTISMLESDLGEPIVLPVAPLAVEDALFRGRVVDLPEGVPPRLEVVERWIIAGAEEPLSFPPYPLAPDGTFGSFRRLGGVLGIEVSVISPSDWSGSAGAGRIDRSSLFDAGGFRLEPRTHAELAFTIEGLGRVEPPLRVTLHGENRLEEIARFRLRGRKLWIDNLHPGSYTLRWAEEPGGGEERGPEGTHAFVVPRSPPARVTATLPREPRAEEVVEIHVSDSGGLPLEDVRVDPAPPPSPREADDEPREPGTHLAVIRPLEPSRFQVASPGYLLASVEMGPRTPVPSRIVLYREGGARAHFLDPGGERLTGTVAVSWQPLSSSGIAHGAPGVFPVEDGRFEAWGLPPVPLVYTFVHEGSGLALRREITLAEGGPALDLGVLRFEETRKLRGTVFLDDGSPAPGAMIAFVPRGAALQLPFRKSPFEQALYSARASAQGVYEFDALPLALPPDLALVAGLHGFGTAREEPVDLSVDIHDFFLAPAAALDLDVGYRFPPDEGRTRGGEPRPPSHGFWLEHVQSGTDPGGRLLSEEVTPLGEIDPFRTGGMHFPAVEPGRYRVKWGLREAYEPLPGIWEEVLASPGRRSRLRLRIEGRVLRGTAKLNGYVVEKGWIILTDAPGQSARVGRIRDGEFTVIDPPDAFRCHAAVIPEMTPQPLQNIARGEALPVAIRNYRAALREEWLEFEYAAHDLTIRFGDDFLAGHQGAVLSFDHYEWDRERFRTFPAEEAIDGSPVDLRLLPPGLHRITVRSARDTMLFTQLVDLKEDRAMEIR